MQGTFNGIRLNTISSRKIATGPDGALYGFRVAGNIPLETSAALDATLRLHGPALLILGDEIVDGRIVHFSADILYGYEITIDTSPITHQRSEALLAAVIAVSMPVLLSSPL
jgi:hypothetical protein